MIPSRFEPWAHQREDLDASWRMPAAAIPWPPRLGKSKLAIDTAARLVDAGEIDAVVVIAPNGVHLNWTRQEIPTHWPLEDPCILEWRSQRAGTVAFRKEQDVALEHEGVVWFAVNVEAVASKNVVNTTGRGGMGFLERFVKRRRCLLIVDESHTIKNHRAKRTKAIMKIADRCPYRRTLTGTPTAQGPFDLWAQYYVLSPEILGRRFTTFKHRYGVFQKRKFGAGPTFDELVEYQNLDELNRRIAPYTFHRVKEECLDLPDRVMTRRYFDLPDEHRRVYRELRDELMSKLASGEEISAPHALTNLLRLQQVSRGHVALEDGTVRDLGSPHPAVDATIELIGENPGKTIVWCRFVSDVVLLDRQFTAQGISHIRCDGSTPQGDRPGLLQRFREDPDAKVWLGTLATGGVGVDLGSADLMVFYSHGFDLVQRLQGLERNYGSSQRSDRVEVVDLVAADTADEKALAALERKEDLASQLTGSKLREIIE